MDAIIWNVRSVKTMQAFERLITMHRRHHFEFIGNLEPMQQARKMERYRKRIGLATTVVNVFNKIRAFIDEVYDVTIVYNMVQQLTLRLFHIETHVELMLTLVYAKCDAIERIELWDSLYAMTQDMIVLWLVGGDFNVIWDEEEKFGGLPFSLNEVDDFRHYINTCNLTDLGFKGSIFTWWNGRPEEDSCILHGRSIHFIQPKKLKKALSIWSKATYGDIFQRIASLEEVVLVHERQFEARPSQQNRGRLQLVQAQLIRYLEIEEDFWKQKSGMTWFKEGDRNIKFFHAQVNGRRKRLQLKRIQNNMGNWIDEEDQIAEEAVNFFKDQFCETEVRTEFGIIDHVPWLIDGEQMQS
ncbi:uncharacterized protein LOC142179966 [Nicotiana tabacum]|uniref:Uncharacterized protein LOC142179966 n=1 Tax=Nicotiana tabacum TaxID=4097 RepID=A0AC58UBV6_TOBAC